MNSISDAINISPVVKELSNLDTFPYTILGNAVNVVNTDVNNMTLTLTHGDGSTTALTIPGNYSWSDHVLDFSSINATGSASFFIQVKRVGG